MSRTGAEICVVFNPHAGRRRARRRLARFLQRWQGAVEFWPTERAGHGIELARRAAESHFRVVAAAGGDGTAHDVANGLLAAERRDVTFAVVPIGSANDYAYSLEKQFGVSSLADDSAYWVDIGVARTASGRQRYFVENLGLGLCGQVTLASREIASLQGPLLYGLAAWRAVQRHAIQQLSIALDGREPSSLPTLMLSILIGKREGSFLMAPDAEVDDGLFDVVHVREISRWDVLRLLPRLYWRGPPWDDPRVQYGRYAAIHVRADSPLTMHTDGEMFSTPDDRVTEVEVALLPKRLRVKVCSPAEGV